MKGMSTKAKIGWALALAFGFLAFMVVVAVQNPTWGARGHPHLTTFQSQEHDHENHR